MILAFAIGAYFLARVLERGESFDSHRSQVHITHSELQFGELHAGPTVAVVGTIQNEGNIAWKTITLEVQYFDTSHKLIDTKQSKQWSDDLFLPAKGNCAFKVSQPREFNSTDYASYDIRIVEARDAHGFLQ